MQRNVVVPALAASVLLALGGRTASGVTTSTRYVHDAGPTDRVTACGVERWRVKVGLDPDARLVKQNVVVPTTIGQLSALRPPATV